MFNTVWSVRRDIEYNKRQDALTRWRRRVYNVRKHLVLVDVDLLMIVANARYNSGRSYEASFSESLERRRRALDGTGTPHVFE